MKSENVSVARLMRLVAFGALVTAVVLLAVAWELTGDGRVVLVGLLMAGLVLLWGLVLVSGFQRKLVAFTNALCRSLDEMTDRAQRPFVGAEADTLLARISHRLERLYAMMQRERDHIAAEKADLQSLLSDISHQTKTPLANLKMLNETLRTRALDEKTRGEMLAATASQLDKLDFLIDALVKTSRLEAGVITLERKRALLVDTLVAALDGIVAPLEQKGLHLSVDCAPDLWLFHDVRWTAEALSNLLDNAVKYTPSGGRIAVRVEAWESLVKIDVTDSGRGIPEREQAAIFQRFYREAAVHEVEGIGLGLYLAREIITLQGGYITVASTPGKGATFSVFLPWQ